MREVAPELALGGAPYIAIPTEMLSLRRSQQPGDRRASIVDGRSESAAVGTLAHTLKGSAASIGAAGVVSAAAAVEQAAGGPEHALAIGRLATAIDDACAAIAGLLAAPKG